MPKDLVNKQEAVEAESEVQITSLGLEQEFNYERPVIDAHIEIDQVGYLPNQKKTAIFRGENLSDSFNVISAETGEIIYEGEIKTKTTPNQNEPYYYGDFSTVNEPGEYYIQTDIIGYSYKFEIKDKIYDTVELDAVKQFYYNRCGCSLTSEYAGDNARTACHTNTVTLQQDGNVALDVTGGWHVDPSGNRNVSRGCSAMETLLLAYEYNTDSFGDDTGIPESGDDIPDILNEVCIEAAWLLKMQEQATGAVYKAVSVVDKGDGPHNPCHVEGVDISTTLIFASAMAYFSYIYQNYDNAFATTCLKAADRAMKYAAKFPEEINSDEYFRAATMMYRATGYSYYSNIINNYMSTVEKPDMSNGVVFIGCVSYLATKQRTNRHYCDIMMKSLKEYAEKLLDERGDVLYLMGDKITPIDHTTLLSEIARLTVVNYIISSNEYEQVMLKYLHYFMGCNPSNMCYVGQYGSVNATDSMAALDIIKQPEQDAYFILLLSGILLE